MAVSELPNEALEVVSPLLKNNHRQVIPEGQLLPKLGTLQETRADCVGLLSKLHCSGLLSKLCPSQGISPRGLLSKFSAELLTKLSRGQGAHLGYYWQGTARLLMYWCSQSSFQSSESSRPCFSRSNEDFDLRNFYRSLKNHYKLLKFRRFYLNFALQ